MQYILTPVALVVLHEPVIDWPLYKVVGVRETVIVGGGLTTMYGMVGCTHSPGSEQLRSMPWQYPNVALYVPGTVWAGIETLPDNWLL